MANYQTDFLQALSMAGNSLSGLMQDIREPTFQEQLKLREESQMRLNQQGQNFALERMGVDQDYALERMDKSTEEALEQYGGQKIIDFQDMKDRDEYLNLNPERAEQMQKIEQAIKERDTDWLRDNYEENIDLHKDIEIYAEKANKKVNEQDWLNYLSFGMFGYEGKDKIQAERDDFFFDKETGRMLRRNDEFYKQERDFREVNKVVEQAAGVSPEFSQENQDMQGGLNSYYGMFDLNDPNQMNAAHTFFRMQNEGMYAEMLVQNQKMTAMDAILGEGKTPELSVEDIIAGVDKQVPKDRLLRRTPDNRMEYTAAQKNAYASSLGLVTLQAQYALQDKFGGINRDRQKEALKDLVQAKSMAEKLMKNTKFGSTPKDQIDRDKKYYQESIKLINTWMSALQR
mgnify:CR=1 FL=1|jgi:hypothetical protein|tara:strand:- start:3361 stop:4563 length:1203 start_codon:yes stop_codon:yes gene_type:complete